MTVKLDPAALDSAIGALEDLASAIDYHRSWCTRDCPVELASLAEGTGLTQVRDWMNDQVASPLQVVRDLAHLLDTEGNGTAEFEGSGDIDTLRETLGTELASQMQDFGDLDTPEDIERFQDLMGTMDRYKDDIVVSGSFHTELGPQGLADVLYQVRSLTDPGGQYQRNLLDLTGDSDPSYPEASQLAVDLQDSFAGLMASSLATGSLWKDFPGSYAEDLVNVDDGSTSSIIFDYAGRNGDVFARDFLNEAGDALLEREDGGGGQSWGAGSDYPQFGTADMDQLRDPVLQWMEALKHNPAASQDQLLDTDRAEYLLDERFYLYEDPEGNAAGDVLASATIDQALRNDSMGENAATISSWALNHFGGDADPRDGLKEELGGIVATYMRDVGRVSLDPNSADTPGIYGPGDLPPGSFEGDGFPPYGIRLDRDALNNLLGDIGDNDTAISVIGESSGRYTQARLNDAVDSTVNGGPFVDGEDPFNLATFTNSATTGFLYDGLLDGSINDAQEDAANREKIFNLLMVPTEFAEVPGGPVGSYVVGEIKDMVKDEFVGDGASEAVTSAEDNYDAVRTYTLMQSLHTLVASDAAATLPVGSLREDWPTEGGVPVNPNDLTNEQRTDIIASITSTDEENGYAASTYREAMSGIDVLQEQYQ